MAKTKANNQSAFPPHNVPNAEKGTKEYGMKVAEAIERDWFRPNGTIQQYYQNKDAFHSKRLYAMGNQNVAKYKQEFSSTGDLSYLNLDWTPVPIIPKFVDIIVNGMQERDFSIKTTAIDPVSQTERKRFINRLRGEMENREELMALQQETGVNVFENNPNELPANNEELELHVQLNYKQNVEIAMETAIEYVNMLNRDSEIKRKVDYDLVTLGIGAKKVTFNTADGIKIDYVDPANLVYSQNINSDNYNDCFYFGEVKRVHISEIMKMFPDLTNEQIENMQANVTDFYNQVNNPYNDNVGEFVELIYFCYKTTHNEIYKIKGSSNGMKKAIERDESFNPPKDKRTEFEKTHRINEVVYEGIKVAGCEMLLKWELAKNMMRPGAHSPEVIMPYAVQSGKEYGGRIQSIMDRMITYADMIQMTHLKLQQAIQKLTPSGVAIDIDSLADIDLGNGTRYNPHEALNMYFQTGSIVTRSINDDGTGQSGLPITELPGGGGNQVQLLIETYNYYLNMIRDVTGISEATDGSMPDGDTLVGVQKLAAKASNRAVKHIIAASERIIKRAAECVALRISDVVEFSPLKHQFIQAIGNLNVEVLDDMKKIHLHEFGIFVELGPDEEEKQKFDSYVATALTGGLLMPEDVIDLENIKNPKLAIQMLKVRRRLREKQEQEKQSQLVQQQADANAQAAQASEQAKAQAEQLIAQAKIQIEQAKGQLELQRLNAEVEAKKQLMTYEWELNMRGKEVDVANQQKLNQDKLASQERMAKQKSFESKGNDSIGQGFNLEQFDPR